MNEEEIRKALGYCGLFASRDTVQEAMEYVHTIADACGKNNKVGVLTAVGVFHNALIDHIVRNYDLVPKGTVEVDPAFIPTCSTSGVDYKLSEEAHDQAVYIDTPNGTISVFYDTVLGSTSVRGYDGGDSDKERPDFDFTLVETLTKEVQP